MLVLNNFNLNMQYGIIGYKIKDLTNSFRDELFASIAFCAAFKPWRVC